MIILCQRAKKRLANRQDFMAIPTYKLPTYSEQVSVNEFYLQNLLKRTRNYGDITQKQNEESLRALLKKYRNFVPDLILDLILDAEKNGQVYQPPLYYDEGYKHMPNPGQWFLMPRGHKKELQAKYYKVGDHHMRIMGSIKNLEQQELRGYSIFESVKQSGDSEVFKQKVEELKS